LTRFPDFKGCVYLLLAAISMIDKERRKKLAFHLRHLSAGVISNDEFEESISDDVSYGWLPEQYYRSRHAKSDDPVIQPMLELCWGLYDDTRNHKLKNGDSLSGDDLKTIARCILFLHSDKEYEWPYFDTKLSLTDALLTVLTLGIYYRLKGKQRLASYKKWQLTGDFEVWPFFRKTDYDVQLTQQPFLTGARIG
jgi:hypothetical protein